MHLKVFVKWFVSVKNPEKPLMGFLMVLYLSKSYLQ